MGTRADFYVGRGATAEWLGSVAWDGGPDGIGVEVIDRDMRTWRVAVADFLASREDGTTSEMGWPWPWKDSTMTDFAYAWDDGEIWVSNFGSEWVRVADWRGDQSEPVVFPDMTSVQAVTFGPRSGVTILGG